MPFSKEERVLFEDELAGFNDLMVESKAVSVFGTNGQLMERANDTIWRPVPYIMASQTRTIGTPVTTQVVNQLTVPSRLNINRNVTWSMTALELRDAIQEGNIGRGSRQRIASDINTSVRSVAATQGTLVVPITGAAGTYDNVALAQSIMDEQGVPAENRYMFLPPRERERHRWQPRQREPLVRQCEVGQRFRAFRAWPEYRQLRHLPFGRRCSPDWCQPDPDHRHQRRAGSFRSPHAGRQRQ